MGSYDLNPGPQEFGKHIFESVMIVLVSQCSLFQGDMEGVIV